MQKRYSNSGQLSQKEDLVAGSSSRFGTGMNNQGAGYEPEGGGSGSAAVGKTLPSIKLNAQDAYS